MALYGVTGVNPYPYTAKNLPGVPDRYQGMPNMGSPVLWNVFNRIYKDAGGATIQVDTVSYKYTMSPQGVFEFIEQIVPSRKYTRLTLVAGAVIASIQEIGDYSKIPPSMTITDIMGGLPGIGDTV